MGLPIWQIEGVSSEEVKMILKEFQSSCEEYGRMKKVLSTLDVNSLEELKAVERDKLNYEQLIKLKGLSQEEYKAFRYGSFPDITLVPEAYKKAALMVRHEKLTKKENKMDFSKLPIGTNRVWDFVRGWGTITEITKGDNFPICVAFESGGSDAYSTGGCFRDNVNQSLFLKSFEPPKDINKMPMPEIKAGTIVRTINSGKNNTGVVADIGIDALVIMYKQGGYDYLSVMKDKISAVYEGRGDNLYKNNEPLWTKENGYV